MEMVDAYTSHLTKIIKEMETIYEIDGTNGTDVVSVIGAIDQKIVEMSAEEIAEKNREVGKHVVLLAYLSSRLKYFQSCRFDFSNFPALGEVVKILDLYREKKNFNKCARQLNKIIKILAEVDKASVKARFSLGYRYLRIFVVLVMYRSSCNASIVAELILQQIIIKSEGVNAK